MQAGLPGVQNSEQHKALIELRQKVMDTTKEKNLTTMRMESKTGQLKRNQIVLHELNELGSDTITYESVGKAFFKSPHSKVIERTEDNSAAVHKDIETLKRNLALQERSVKDREEEFRRLLMTLKPTV